MALVELNNENAVVTSIIRYKKDLTVGENTPDWPPIDRLTGHTPYLNTIIRFLTSMERKDSRCYMPMALSKDGTA